MYDLSIVFPGVRTQNWLRLYETAVKSAGKYSVEIVAVGPFNPPPELLQKDNFLFIKEDGSPCYCVQIGALQAEGKLITWTSDDGFFIDNSLELAIDLYKKISNYKLEIIMRYFEGPNHTGSEDKMGANYWNAHTHQDLRLPGILDYWKIAPVGMLSLDYFKKLGGFDCRFQCVNACTHDLSFRIQKDDGELIESPMNVLNCNWEHGQGCNIGILKAHFENDYPWLKYLYDIYNPNRINIPYDNWKHIQNIWNKFRSV